MILENEFVIYLVEALALGALFVFLYKIQERKYRLKIDTLEKENNTLKQKTPLKEEENKPSVKPTSFVLSEIEKREKLEKEIEKLKAVINNTKMIAQDASMVKTEFLSNMRHEIRTPLNSILVFAELLEKELEDKKLSSFATNINNGGRKLLMLLDNIIELSSIESGSFEIHESAVHVEQFFNSIVDFYKQDISNKGLEFSMEIDEIMPDSLMLDTTRVKEIIENLLSNAIKFTSQGFIRLSISVINFDAASNTVDIVIRVKDSGSGISKENQSKIFEIFEKKDNCNAIEFEGTGLGLSINRKLAHLMNGSLEVNSMVSKGSTFILTLKGLEVVLQKVQDESENVSVDFSLIKPDGARILIVDTQKENSDVVIASFQNSAVKVVSYDNSREAIEYLKNNEVDMILIDIDLLSEDEGAVSQVIKKISKAPVVTLTQKRLKGVNYGVGGVEPVGHLLKPIVNTALFKIVLQTLHSEKFDTVKLTNDDAAEDNFDKEKIMAFLDANEISLKKLYDKALATNDLNTIRKFAQELLQASSQFQIQELNNFSKMLLEKIELFEIDAISDMLKLYNSKIKRYKSTIKE